MAGILISDAALRRLAPAKSAGGYVLRDRRLAGFLVRVGLKKKVFRLQLDVFNALSEKQRQRRTLSFPLGTWPATSAEEARKKAKDILDRRDRGEPLIGPTGDVTLLETWRSYELLLAKKKAAAKTIKDYRNRIESHLKELHHKPLRGITRSAVVNLHNRITKAGAPYMANGVMRVGHAVYNHALRDLEVPGLSPLNPFRLRGLANREEPRQTGMDEDGIARWFAQVLGLSNPAMREFQLLVALTGRRRSAVAALRWEHVHVRERYIEFYTDKGISSGRAKPDRIPLSRPMLRSLWRVRRAGRVLCDSPKCRPWVFPSSRSASGHIEEPKGKSRHRSKDGKVVVKHRVDASPHALRHTWISQAPQYMSKAISKILVGHKLSSDIHEEYMSVASMFNQLREPQSRLQLHLLSLMHIEPERKLTQQLLKDLAAVAH